MAPHRHALTKPGRTRLWVAAGLTAVTLASTTCAERPSLAAKLDDAQWWALIETVSEPPGRFDISENLVSNEPGFAERVRWLRPAGGAYIGVGPEQNFSYIAALEPEIAFIVDIRRDNLVLHLMYKALFEIATDRADFVSRLFSRPRPAGLSSDATVEDLFEQFDAVIPSAAALEHNLRLIRERLLELRRLPLTEAELAGMSRALAAFQTAGPAIHFWGAKQVDATQPSYRALMTARDWTGRHRSFLATEAGFHIVKNLHSRNLIVPVVGDFGGPAALRRIGQYLREHGAKLHAFYASNVGTYLTNQEALEFCRNLASLPVAPRAIFAESNRLRPFAAKLKDCPTAQR